MTRLVELTKSESELIAGALCPLSNAAFPDERECLSDHDVQSAKNATGVLRVAIARDRRADTVEETILLLPAEANRILTALRPLASAETRDARAALTDKHVAEASVSMALAERSMAHVIQCAARYELLRSDRDVDLRIIGVGARSGEALDATTDRLIAKRAKERE